MAEDPYVYPGTRVLRNLWGTRDPVALASLEGKATTIALTRLRRNPVAGCYDLAHLQAIHKRIFDGVYPWAGQLRTVNIAKGGQMFAPHQHIQSYLTAELAGLEREDYLRGLKRDRFLDRLAHYLGELNAAHPFREGNGRTQRAFLGQLARQAGHEIAWRRVGAQQNIEASRASHNGDNTHLRALLDQTLQDPRPQARERVSDESAPRLADRYRRLLGPQRTAQVEGRARDLVAPSAGLTDEQLHSARQTGLHALSTLDRPGALLAVREELVVSQADARARLALRRAHQLARGQDRAPRDPGPLELQRRLGANAGAESDRAHQRLGELTDQGRHPAGWFADHADHLAGALAAEHEQAQRAIQASTARSLPVRVGRELSAPTDTERAAQSRQDCERESKTPEAGYER